MEWAARLSDSGLSPSTVANVWWFLAAAIKLQRARVGVLPWDDFKPPRDPEPDEEKRGAMTSIEEVEALLRVAVAANVRALRVGELGDLPARIAIVFYLALRQGEAAALGWDDLVLPDVVQQEDGTIAVVDVSARCDVMIRHNTRSGWRGANPAWTTRPMDPPKGKRQVRLPLHHGAVAILLAHRQMLRDRGIWRADGPVFPRRSGDWRREGVVIDSVLFRQLCREAGLEHWRKMSPHSLRHSAATLELAASGFNAQLVQRRLRHASLQTTMGYFHRYGPAVAGRSVMPTLQLPDSFDPLPKLLPLANPLDMIGAPAAAAASASQLVRSVVSRTFEVASERAKTASRELGNGGRLEAEDLALMTAEAIAVGEQARDLLRGHSERARRSKARALGREVPALSLIWMRWSANKTNAELLRIYEEEGNAHWRAKRQARARPAELVAACERAYSRAYTDRRRELVDARLRALPADASEEARAAAAVVTEDDKRAARAAGSASKKGLLSNWRREFGRRLRERGLIAAKEVDLGL
jgi:integrase